MVAKRTKRAVKKVRNLGVKGVGAKQAKGVKGGSIAIITPSSTPKVGTELLPYIEQKRNP